MTADLFAGVATELGKLRRSLGWSVVVGLPVIMVFAGAFTTVVSGEPLADGWHTLWLRSLVFYGLLPLTLGLAILASLAWRTEHRDGNWNALMTTPVPSWQIVLSKTLAIGVLAAAMQVLLLLVVIAAGTLLFGLPGMLPARYFAITAVLIIATLPVVALQSALSLAIRSFAVPVAIAAAGAGVAAVALMAKLPGVAYLLPYAVTARSTQLATGTFGDSGRLTAPTVVALLIASVLLTAAVTVLAARYLDRRDVHA